MDTIEPTNHAISADQSSGRKGGSDRTVTLQQLIEAEIEGFLGAHAEI